MRLPGRADGESLIILLSSLALAIVEKAHLVIAQPGKHCLSFWIGSGKHLCSFLSLSYHVWPPTAVTTLVICSAWPDACALGQVPWVCFAMMSIHDVVCFPVRVQKCAHVHAHTHTILPKTPADLKQESNQPATLLQKPIAVKKCFA